MGGYRTTDRIEQTAWRCIWANFVYLDVVLIKTPGTPETFHFAKLTDQEYVISGWDAESQTLWIDSIKKTFL